MEDNEEGRDSGRTLVNTGSSTEMGMVWNEFHTNATRISDWDS